MSTVAEQLLAARQAQKLTVQQAAEITKIRGDHLRALESGDFDVFSAPVYIRGFVRSYSTLLKMDVPQVMAALERELSQTTKFAAPPPLSDRRRGVLDFFTLQLSKIDWQKAVWVVGALVLIVAISGGVLLWRQHQKRNPLAGLKPGVYHSTQTVSGDTLPLPAPTPKR